MRKRSLEGRARTHKLQVGTHDPIIVLVDPDIEKAIEAMARDLSPLKKHYSSDKGVDWVTLQYHLSLMQFQAATGWTAPGFRKGGRKPPEVRSICQKLISHDAFTKCHSTDLKEWHKVKHMLTLKRNPDICKRYVHEAVSALLEYNKVALEKNAEFETVIINESLNLKKPGTQSWVTSRKHCARVQTLMSWPLNSRKHLTNPVRNPSRLPKN